MAPSNGHPSGPLDQGTRETLERVLEEASRLLPDQDARLTVEDGPEATHILGDEVGYLALGIALARGAMKPPVKACGFDGCLDIGKVQIDAACSDRVFVFRHGTDLETKIKRERWKYELKDLACLGIAAIITFVLFGIFGLGIKACLDLLRGMTEASH